MVDLPVYELHPAEIERYEKHGLASAAIRTLARARISGCSIDTHPLLEIKRPASAWIRETRQLPTVYIASAGFTNIPSKFGERNRQTDITFHPKRTLEAINLTFSPHPKINYTNVELAPLYRQMREYQFIDSDRTDIDIYPTRLPTPFGRYDEFKRSWEGILDVGNQQQVLVFQHETKTANHPPMPSAIVAGYVVSEIRRNENGVRFVDCEPVPTDEQLGLEGVLRAAHFQGHISFNP